MEQVLALHGLLQQRSILQHQSLDLVQQVAILLLKVSLQLAQQLTHTQKKCCMFTRQRPTTLRKSQEEASAGEVGNS